MSFKKRKKEKIQCPKCGHIWNTRSKMMYITCPNCMRKIKRENENE